MIRVPILIALLATLAASSAAEARRPVVPPASGRQIISLVVYGEDGCPKAIADEIVICARKPESERYRIPKDLRQEPVAVGTQGWGSRVAAVEADARQLIPGSCSPIGSNGQTGCAQAALARWYWDRRQQQQLNAIP